MYKYFLIVFGATLILIFDSYGFLKCVNDKGETAFTDTICPEGFKPIKDFGETKGTSSFKKTDTDGIRETSSRYSSPSFVEKKIRQIYREKYPNDFSMQKTLVEDQLESYSFLQRWSTETGVPQDIFSMLKSKYAKKYPVDYSMQKTLIKDQCESYRFVQSYTSASGVPSVVFNDIKRKYANKYPNDFSMQKTLVEDQVESYLDLHK